VTTRLIVVVAILSVQGIAEDPPVGIALESATVKSGRKGAVKLSVTIPPGRQAAGLNWVLRYPPPVIEDMVVRAGPAADAAQKSLKCRPLPGEVKCVLFGLNTNVIASGTLATVTFRVRKGLAKSSADIQVTDLVVASPSGSSVPCSASNGSISVRK